MLKRSAHIKLNCIVMSVIIGIVLSASVLTFAQDNAVGPAVIMTGTFLGETPPLRELPGLTEEEIAILNEKGKQKILNPSMKRRSYPYAETALPKGADPVWQKHMGDSRESRAPIQTFEGSFVSGLAPTDPNGTVGPEHYMQTINTVYMIYNRAGYVVAGPTAINTLFYGVAGAEYNNGDPIVLYDEQADRWVLAEFSISGTNDYLMIAISTTNDPTGTWYKYSFDVWDVPDYPKLGVWRDAYYVGTNTYGNPDIYVLQRSQMLQGLAPSGMGFDNPWRPGPSDSFNCVPPLDNDGVFAPEGEPGLFIAFNDDAVGGGSDELWVYELDVNWDTLQNSTFSRSQQISVSSFDSNFGTSQASLSQLNTTQKLDAIPMVIMNPPQYRNFGTYETIVCCHTVDVDNTDHAGIRWYELRRVAGGDWTLRQEGTYAPDNHSRWMASIALNGANEIGLGYSITGSSLYPGIRFCGQTASAYAAGNGILDVSEQVIYDGIQSQLNTFRWGDYSSIQVDVLDDETFWFTSQYVTGASGSQVLRTKVASFQIGTVSLKANFAASNINPQTYSAVTLTDASFGSPTSWQWSITPTTFNFLAGTTASSQNPQIQFTEAGSYSVTLISSIGGNSDTITKTAYIEAIDCGFLYLPFTEDFSDGVLPTCWKNIDNRGLGEIWLFDNPYGWTINTTTGANGFAILDSYYYNSGYSQNADLITPLLDLSDYTTVNLFFEHFYPYYSPEPNAAYGRLYFSIDGGASWTLKQSWYFSANGDDVNINMTTNVAGQSKVRFKWNYTGYGYFWAIDDISITGTGPNTWTGVTSSDWSDGTNWSAGTVPAGTSKVIIPTTAPNWPDISGSLMLGTSCDKLTLFGSSQIDVDGDFTLTSGKTLIFNGDATVNLTGNLHQAGATVLPGNGTFKFSGNSPSKIIPITTTTTSITNYYLSTFPKGMTNLSGATTGPSGDNTAANVSLGFTFNYLGVNYTQTRICTNGWLTMNLSGLTSSTNARLFNTSAPNTTLSPWWDDLEDDATSVISYKTEGSAPYRVFTAEWKNVLTYSSGATERISFQVKLYETSNIIEFHYGDIVPGTNNASESASIGIEDATGDSGHFIEATTGSTTTGVSNLTVTSNWPVVNYRFSPPPTPLACQNISIDKNNSYLDTYANTTINGDLLISDGSFAGPSAKTGLLYVKGNWINNGSYIPGKGKVILNGTMNQNVDGSSSTAFNRLTINNHAGITLLENITVADTLSMLAGNILNDTDTLELGTSASLTGYLSYTSGNITGPFKRWIAASTATPVDYPLGTTTNNHKARITFSNNTGGSLIARFEPGDPGNNGEFPITNGSETINENDLYTEGSWTLVPAGLSSTSYALELTGTDFSSAGEPDETVRILKRPDAGGNWTLDGTHVDGSAPVAKRTGLSGFSRFALAKPGQFVKILGSITYYNAFETPLTSGITVKLFQDDNQVGSDYIVSDGTYEFSGLNPGNYELRVSSSLLTDGSINTTDAAQVNFWGAMPYEIEKVRFYAGDVTGGPFFINSTDALRIQQNFVNGAGFDKGNWVFWRSGETISANTNPPESYPQVSLGTSNITANLYGLCAGDFNRSFIPGATKSQHASVSLLHYDVIMAGKNEIIELPLISINSLTIGAISLILDFPDEESEIQDVLIPSGAGILEWAVRDNVIRISWSSMNPLSMDAGDTLITLVLKTKDHFSSGEKIRINLSPDPLNELADGTYGVIPEAILSVYDIEYASTGETEPDQPADLSLHCYPNPCQSYTTISYFLPAKGKVVLEIFNSLGHKTAMLANELQPEGRHEYFLQENNLAIGIYMAKLTFSGNVRHQTSTIKFIKR